MKPYIVFLLAMFIASCTTSYETAKKHYDLAQPCCSNFSEFKYENLSHEASLVFDINQLSPAFHFDTGKSYFKAVRLPNISSLYVINIRSYAMGERLDVAHIFFPKIVLLKEDFTVYEELILQFTLEKEPVGAIEENKWGLPVRLAGEIPIWNDDIKYLLLVTSEEWLSTAFYISAYATWDEVLRGEVMIGPLGIVGDVLFGPQLPHAIKISPFGRLALELKAE